MQVHVVHFGESDGDGTSFVHGVYADLNMAKEALHAIADESLDQDYLEDWEDSNGQWLKT